MKHLSIALSLVASLSLAACVTVDTTGDNGSSSSSSVSSEVPDYSDMISVDVTEGSRLQSPVTITGEARGMWYFEASFPVRLLDGNGNEIAIAPAQAQDDWMTEEFVPFSVTLTFAQPSTPTGTLVLENDNPSGLPENSKKIEIPVTF